jgi:hAT family C-terminal dimerisation region
VCELLITSKKQRPVSISDVIVMLIPPTDGFPDLHQVLRLALIVPVANVAAERSFSCMRRVRTFVRSSMKEDRLSTLSNLNIKNDLAQKIDFDRLIDIYARMRTLRDCTGVLGSDNAGRLDLQFCCSSI